jgi:hypothetical protein
MGGGGAVGREMWEIVWDDVVNRSTKSWRVRTPEKRDVLQYAQTNSVRHEQLRQELSLSGPGNCFCCESHMQICS